MNRNKRVIVDDWIGGECAFMGKWEVVECVENVQICFFGLGYFKTEVLPAR